jgi:hypothetical protein
VLAYAPADNEALPPRKLDNISKTRPNFAPLPTINGRMQIPPWNPRRAHESNAQSPNSKGHQESSSIPKASTPNTVPRPVSLSPTKLSWDPIPDLTTMEPETSRRRAKPNPETCSGVDASLSTLAVVGDPAPVQRQGERKDSGVDYQVGMQEQPSRRRSSKLDVVVDDPTTRRSNKLGIVIDDTDSSLSSSSCDTACREEDQTSICETNGFTTEGATSTSNPGTEPEDGSIQLLWEVGKPAKHSASKAGSEFQAERVTHSGTSPVYRPLRRSRQRIPPNFSRPFPLQNAAPPIPEKSEKRA